MIIVGDELGTPIMSVPSIFGESTSDFTGIVSLLIFWGMLELGVGMVAVCLPTMRPMLRGASVESMMRSLRSFISLPGTSRGGSGTHESERENIPLDERDKIKKKVEYSVTSSLSDDHVLSKNLV